MFWKGVTTSNTPRRNEQKGTWTAKISWGLGGIGNFANSYFENRFDKKLETEIWNQDNII